jgi:hypothetical protein
MVVATNAVATHAMTIDATAQAERASAWSSSVTVCRIAAGPMVVFYSEIRRGDALEDALDDLASHHRGLRVGRCARVVRSAVCQPPYLDGGLEAGQHQEKLFQHGQLAARGAWS